MPRNLRLRNRHYTDIDMPYDCAFEEIAVRFDKRVPYVIFKSRKQQYFSFVPMIMFDGSIACRVVYPSIPYYYILKEYYDYRVIKISEGILSGFVFYQHKDEPPNYLMIPMKDIGQRTMFHSSSNRDYVFSFFHIKIEVKYRLSLKNVLKGISYSRGIFKIKYLDKTLSTLRF